MQIVRFEIYKQSYLISRETSVYILLFGAISKPKYPNFALKRPLLSPKFSFNKRQPLDSGLKRKRRLHPTARWSHSPNPFTSLLFLSCPLLVPWNFSSKPDAFDPPPIRFPFKTDPYQVSHRRSRFHFFASFRPAPIFPLSSFSFSALLYPFICAIDLCSRSLTLSFPFQLCFTSILFLHLKFDGRSDPDGSTPCGPPTI